MIKNDEVNCPKHYVPENPAYECVKVAEAWGLDKDAYLFNVLKYICRAGKKDPNKEIQDLEKANFFLSRRIENLKKDKVAADKILKEEEEAIRAMMQTIMASFANLERKVGKNAC